MQGENKERKASSQETLVLIWKRKTPKTEMPLNGTVTHSKSGVCGTLNTQLWRLTEAQMRQSHAQPQKF